jgi:hypothetical protein
MHDHYEDCPWREQALYALDGRSEMLTAFYAFKETKLTAASLRLMANSIREDNLLELCSPGRVSITIPYFSAAFVLALGEYYHHSGDEETVSDLLPVAYDILSGYYGRMKHHGWLLPSYRQKQYWNFYEWQDGLTESIGKESDPEALTFDAPLMALVSMAFTAYANTLTALGQKNNDDAMIDQGDAVLHCSEELNEQLNNHFYDEEKGLYRTYLSVSLSDGSPYPPEKPHYAELTQELAVLCGAAKDGNHLDDLLDRIHHRTEMIPSTLASALFRYADGRCFNFFATTAGGCDMPVQVTLTGNGHTVTATPDTLTLDGHAAEKEGGHAKIGKDVWGDGHAKLVADFYRSVEENTPFAIDGEEGAKVVRAILAMYRSNGKETPLTKGENR